MFKIPKTKYPALLIMRWLWHELRGNRLQSVLNALLGVADVVLSLAQVWAVKHAIDIASGSEHDSIYWAVALMGFIILANFGVSIAGVWVRNILGVRAQNRMQQRMLAHILQAEWHSRERHHSGDVLNRLEIDVTTVVTFLTETLSNTLSVILMFVGAFACMFVMDHTLAVLLVAIMPVFLAASRIYVGRMRSLTRLVRDSDSHVQSAMQETVQHRMVVKTLEAGDDMVTRLESTQSELRSNVVKRTIFSIFSNFVLNLGFAIGYLVAFLWAAVRMSAGTLTFGGMTAFLQLVNKIQTPARNLTKLAPAFVGVLTAAERLIELLEEPLEPQGEPQRMDAPCGLRLQNVTYRYEDGTRNVVDNLSFDFAPGTCTAILGETGAGKTTVVRMLLALSRPTSGNIYIYNKVETRELTSLMRCNFVYVPQGNTLMSGTIRDNLLLGNPNASEAEMWEVLSRSCADFVRTFPLGLDAKCGEQGGGLSEGQAQRIAIARALLRKGSIMIFDEATSALDADTECRLLESLMHDNRHTVIFITHRPAVLKYCTQTLQL
ncbi:ABC transporter ATP-binding protein [Prevotella sp.]|uniref:ABC transporter ATP-binding protein n=1 Tax=Prevotella sp. TaxID=59823 RepID=UPI002A800082|nr:ABC transporter ATP-binding protein [Prevotella sp.]MDY4644737.1 ABC transporter ATP-binding protein [Prevotella sp.]